MTNETIERTEETSEREDIPGRLEKSDWTPVFGVGRLAVDLLEGTRNLNAEGRFGRYLLVQAGFYFALSAGLGEGVLKAADLYAQNFMS